MEKGNRIIPVHIRRSRVNAVQLIRQRLSATAIISIGHRSSLAQFHDRFLKLVPDGEGAHVLSEVKAAAE